MRILASLLFALAFASPAHAEPVSIQCDGKFYQQRQPYFVTFELDASRFVYERAGGNMLPGEIIAANDERLELSLKATGGRILLYFDRKRNLMTWPGMPAEELGRPLLQHACTVVTGRTVLSAFYQPEKFDPKQLDPVDAFSLTCPGNTGNYFVTLDHATKTVVLETEHASGILSGNVTGVDDGVIRLTVRRVPPSEQFDLVWDERKRLLTWIGVADNPARPTKSHECIVTKPRSITEFYPDLSRWR